MIYLVRHGQTEMNLQGRIQGQGDAPLTDEGRVLAANTGQKLAEKIGDEASIILTSPLGRAAQTAKIIADKMLGKTRVVEDERLAEVSLGDWDGLTIAEIDERWPGIRSSVPSGEWLFIAPSGEGFDVFRDRNAAFLGELPTLDASHKIIVTHGISSRVLRGLHSDMPREAVVNLPIRREVFFVLHDHGEIEEISIA